MNIYHNKYDKIRYKAVTIWIYSVWQAIGASGQI